MKIAGYELHPLAEKLPKMEDADFEKFAADIEKNGLLDPIVLYAGKVLDGRHRLLACEKTGVKPRFEEWGTLTAHTETTPLEYVISKNFHRRQLTQSQKGIIATEMLHHFEEQATARRLANLKKGGAKPESAPVRDREEVQGKATEQAAKAAGISARTMQQAKFVAEQSPELAEKVRSGEVSLKKAEKQIRKAAQVQAAKVYVPPTGEFSVIFTDYPWKYDDQLDGSDSVRGGCPYPTMTVEEIAAFPLPAAKDCVQFMCITHQHLLAGAHLPILKAQGFTARNWFTWKKPHFGTGHLLRNITEHVIIATKGNPTLVPLSSQTTWFEAPVGEHSEKPDQLFALCEQMAPAPASARLEMFSRISSRPGWTITGSELGKLDGKLIGKQVGSTNCYVCSNPTTLGQPGLTSDALGIAHNVCLNGLSSDAAQDRRRRMAAAAEARKEKEELNGVPAADFERECRVRGFTPTETTAGPTWTGARCNSCSEVIEVGVFHDGALDASHVDEIREHTCDPLKALEKRKARAAEATVEVCYVCRRTLDADLDDPTQLGLDGKSAHESCLKPGGLAQQAPLPLLQAAEALHPATAIACPDYGFCSAKPGANCRSGSGVERIAPHATRIKAFEKSQRTARTGMKESASAERARVERTAHAAITWTTKGTTLLGRANGGKDSYRITRHKAGKIWREERGYGEWGYEAAHLNGDFASATPFPSVDAAKAWAESNAEQNKAKGKRNPREGLCDLQGKDAVKRCQLKEGHRGKCKLNTLRGGAR